MSFHQILTINYLWNYALNPSIIFREDLHLKNANPKPNFLSSFEKLPWSITFLITPYVSFCLPFFLFGMSLWDCIIPLNGKFFHLLSLYRSLHGTTLLSHVHYLHPILNKVNFVPWSNQNGVEGVVNKVCFTSESNKITSISQHNH